MECILKWKEEEEDQKIVREVRVRVSEEDLDDLYHLYSKYL